MQKETKIKISCMSGKLEGIQSINTNPLTNKFCMMQQQNNNKQKEPSKNDLKKFDKTFNVFDKRNMGTNCENKKCLDCMICYDKYKTNKVIETIKLTKQKDVKNICTACYSCKILRTHRKNCIPSFEHNSTMLSKPLKESEIPTINSFIFRFHSHGELINKDHFINFLRICNKNPKTTFTLWTKKYNIVNKVLSQIGKPENLILIYSNPNINTIVQL